MNLETRLAKLEQNADKMADDGIRLPPYMHLYVGENVTDSAYDPETGEGPTVSRTDCARPHSSPIHKDNAPFIVQGGERNPREVRDNTAFALYDLYHTREVHRKHNYRGDDPERFARESSKVFSSWTDAELLEGFEILWRDRTDDAAAVLERFEEYARQNHLAGNSIDSEAS